MSLKIQCVLLCLMICVKLVNSNLPTLELLENRPANLLYCLLKEESQSTDTSIVWETNQSDVVKISRYKPNLFYCSVGKDNKCTKHFLNDFWTLDNSLNYDFDAILDRRWESFEAIKTTPMHYELIDIPSIYLKLQLKVSLKTNCNGFIYLCDGNFPPESNCYWITLSSSNPKEINVKRCDKGTTPLYQGVNPRECTDEKENEPGWNSFVITSFNSMINIESENHKIKSYQDSYGAILIRYIFIASLTNSPALWKINQHSKTHRTGEPQLIHKFLKNDLNRSSITFSVKKGADSFFVVICEDNVFDGLCYKVVFNDNEPNTICKVSQYGCIKDTKSFWPPLKKSAIWYHFKFLSEDNIFTFLTDDNENVAEFKDKDFTANYFFIGSEDSVIWKIHSYDFISTKKSGVIEFPLQGINQKGNVCLAIFAMKTPQANLSLSLYNKDTEIVNYSVTKDNVWEEVFLKAKIGNDVELYLNISTSTDGHKIFISDFRDCSDNNRVLELNTTKMMMNKSPVCASVRYPELNIQSRRGVNKQGTIIVKNSEEIDLLWVSNSKNKNFTLKYIPIKYVDCKKKIFESNVTVKYVVPDDFGSLLYANLSGLMPFVTYNFTISNEKEGVILEQIIDMFPKETLDEDDLPTIQTNQDRFNLEIVLSTFDCNKIKGHLFYILTIQGADPWNADFKENTVTKKFYQGSMSHSYKILGYSRYNVTILFSRNEKFLDNILYHNITILTSPTAPLSIPNITMHSKSTSSISLRWSKPYPPTGQLENYFIQYWIGIRQQELRVAKIAIDSNCMFWPDLICGEINNLKANENYTICVVGKNLNSKNLSECVNPIYVTTKEDRPEPPQNFTVSLQDLVMIVNFERPDKTYGRLIFCIITVDQRNFMFPIEGEDNKSYSMAANIEEFSSKNVTVSLQVTNLGGVSDAIYTTIKTPPKTPIIERSGNFEFFNQTFIEFKSLIFKNLDGFSEAFVFIPKYPHNRFIYNCSELNDSRVSFHTKLLRTELNKEDPKLNVSLNDELREEITKALVVVIRNSYDGEERCVSQKVFLKLEFTKTSWVISVVSLIALVISTIFYSIYKVVVKKILFRLNLYHNTS